MHKLFMPAGSSEPAGIFFSDYAVKGCVQGMDKSVPDFRRM